MLTKNTSKLLELPFESSLEALRNHMRPALWQAVALVSLCAAIGSGWRVLVFRSELVSPLAAAATMMPAVFGGWYVWGFFIYLTNSVLFGVQARYRETLNAFGKAYLFQALFFLTFLPPLGWLWGWVAFYSTVVAWGMIGPRYLGMRTWQATLAAALGMLLWLACLLILTLTVAFDGTYVGIGAFLS